MKLATDKQAYLGPTGDGTGPSAPPAYSMPDGGHNPSTAYGLGVTPHSPDIAYQSQVNAFTPGANQVYTAPPPYPGDPPPYDSLPANIQRNPAQETCCSIFKRCIKKAGGVALITLAGIGGFLLTIALSPLFGIYIVGKAIGSGSCFICVLNEDGAKVVGIILLAAIAIASLPVIICSPVFALDFAYRAGRSLYGDEFNAPKVLVDAHEFIDNLWNGCKSTEHNVYEV